MTAPATDRTADENEMREFRKALALACNDPGHFVGFKSERSLGEWQVDALLSGPLAPILQEAASARKERDEALARTADDEDTSDGDALQDEIDLHCEAEARAQAAEAEAAHLRAENANLRDRVREAEKDSEAMREALESLVDSLKWSEHTPSVDPIYGGEVEALGRRIGFGALMSSASASWADRLGPAKGGEFVAGPCRSVLKADLRRARAALNPNKEAGDAVR